MILLASGGEVLKWFFFHWCEKMAKEGCCGMGRKDKKDGWGKRGRKVESNVRNSIFWKSIEINFI